MTTTTTKTTTTATMTATTTTTTDQVSINSKIFSSNYKPISNINSLSVSGQFKASTT